MDSYVPSIAAFDDMLTSAAVGLGGVRQGAGGQELAARDLGAAARRALRSAAAPTSCPAASSTGTASGWRATCRASPPSEEPDAWTAEDALFVPLRDPKGLLIGVISVDEPDTGRRPDGRGARRPRGDLAPRGARAADRAGHRQRRPAPAHARGHPGGVGAPRRGRGAGGHPPGRLRRHPRRARLRQGRDRAGAPRAACRSCRTPRAAGTWTRTP